MRLVLVFCSFFLCTEQFINAQSIRSPENEMECEKIDGCWVQCHNSSIVCDIHGAPQYGPVYCTEKKAPEEEEAESKETV